MRKFIFATFCCLFIASSLYLLAIQIRKSPQEIAVPNAGMKLSEKVAWTKTAVGAGEIVRLDKLLWRPLNGDAPPEDVLILKSDQDKIDPAAVFSRDLKAGSAIKKSDIREPGDPGYVPILLKHGLRAKVLTIENLSKFDGLIHQGDTVDILFKSPEGTQQVGSKISSFRPLIRNARIIGPVSRTDTLMVALSLQDAMKASLAEDVGKLSILLRNREEDPVWEESLIPLATLAELSSRTTKIVQTKVHNLPQNIRIMRGSDLTTISVPGRATENRE